MPSLRELNFTISSPFELYSAPEISSPVPEGLIPLKATWQTFPGTSQPPSGWNETSKSPGAWGME